MQSAVGLLDRLFEAPRDEMSDSDIKGVDEGQRIKRAQAARPLEGINRRLGLIPRRVFHRLLSERPTPDRCVEAYYLQRPRFESIAQRKLRRRQLTEDGNVEISGRDLR